MLAIIKKWADDSRLPQSERDDFRNEEYRDRIIKHMTKLAQVTAPGAWTVEADMWAFYNQGNYAPNDQLALQLCDIIEGLVKKIEWWSEQDSTFLQRFKDATSKRVLVLFPNSSVDKNCESEYKDGKLIYHVKNVCNIDYEWGGDLLTLLESAVQQKGVRFSTKLGESLIQDMRVGDGDKPFAAIRKLIELDVVDLPMTKDYDYPLFVLVYNWKSKLADMLMPHVKNPNVRDADGETPLITAAKGPNETSWRLDSRERAAQTKMIEVLLKHPQTDVNATDKHGRTALMYVAQTYGWDEAIELLINDPRTDINFENRKMETALDFAVSIKWDWVIKVLRKHREQGTKPSVKVTSVTPVPSAPSAPTFAAIPKAPVKVAYNGSVSSPQSTTTSPSTPPPPPMMPKATVHTTSVVPKSNFGAKVSTFGAAPKKSPQFGSSNGSNTEANVSANKDNGNPPPPPPPMAPKATATSTTSNTFALPKLSPVKNPVQRPTLASPQANNNSNELPPPPPPMAPKSSSMSSTSALSPEQKFSELAKEFNKIVDAYRTFELQVTLASLEDDPLNKILSLNTQLGQTVDQAEKMFNTLNSK